MSTWIITLSDVELVPTGTGIYVEGGPAGGEEIMTTIERQRVVEREGILSLDAGDLTIVRNGIPVIGYARGQWLRFERKEA